MPVTLVSPKPVTLMRSPRQSWLPGEAVTIEITAERLIRLAPGHWLASRLR